jgi:hypothetical protein
MKWLLRTALWFAFGHGLIVACSDAALLEPRGEEEEHGTGGSDPGVTPDSGGRPSGGGKSSPPVTGTGGRFGAGGSPSPGTGGSPSPVIDAAPPTCPPPTVMSVKEFCSQSGDTCHFSSTQLCLTDQIPLKELVEQGCGYVRITLTDSGTGTRYGVVFDPVTGQLVHTWSAPVPCYSVVNVGTMPACSAWRAIPCGSWISRDAGVVDAATD